MKYDTHIASHLGELWSVGDESCCNLVLNSAATRKLLERNPRLGLGVFNTLHSQNEQQWMSTVVIELRDPLAKSVFPMKVVDLLKSICPIVTYNGGSTHNMSSETGESEGGVVGQEGANDLPLDSGRALAVTYLESAIGISTGRPSPATYTDSTTTNTGINPSRSSSINPQFEEHVSDLHGNTHLHWHEK